MRLQKPDPEFTSSARARSNFWLALRVAMGFAAVLWFIQIADSYLGLGLNRFGLRPRATDGLVGVFMAPLLHGGFGHLFNNTAPLLVSLTTMLYLYPNISVRALPMLWFGTAMLTWFIGRPSLHIGASGLIYGMLAFVFVSGVLRQDFRSVAVSLMVWFLYGSMIWGVLPVRSGMSWEMHLSGAVLGVIMAALYRKWDRVPLKTYEWEEDDTVPDWFPGIDAQSSEGDAPRQSERRADD